MIYFEAGDESRAVQAMRVPELFDVHGRTSLSFWLQSIIGRREFIWTGADIVFATTRWKPGDWIVAEVDVNTGNTIFMAVRNAVFSRKFTRADC